jgi:hypothetical protein
MRKWVRRAIGVWKATSSSLDMREQAVMDTWTESDDKKLNGAAGPYPQHACCPMRFLLILYGKESRATYYTHVLNV